MSYKEICATCLVIDVKMIPISDLIRYMYLEITGLQAKEYSSIPCYVCYLCHAQIQKFYTFKKKCLASQKIVNQIKLSKGKITKKAIKEIDRKVLGLELDLSVIKYSETVVPPFIYFSEDEDKIHDDPFAFKTFKIEQEKDEQSPLEPIRSWAVVKIENEMNDIESSYSAFTNNTQQMKLQIDEEDKKVTVEVDSLVADTECTTNESDDDNVNTKYPGNKIKRVKTNKNVKTKKVRKPRKKLVRKRDVNPSEMYKFFHIHRMNLEEEKLQLLSRQMSAFYIGSKYKCELCYSGFSTEEAYRNHKNKHEYGIFGNFLCDYCKIYSSTRTQLVAHMKSSHFYKYDCKTCGHIAYSWRTARLHHRKKHEKVSYKCPWCDKEYKNIHGLGAHKQSFHAAVACDLCGHCFVNIHGLKHHQKYKHGVKDAPKSKEDKEIISQDAPKLTVGKEEDSLYCDVCQIMFANDDAYSLHLVKSSNHNKTNGGRRRMQIVKWNEPCHVCGMNLKTYLEAYAHYKKEHRGTKMPGHHICHVCGKSFTFLHVLRAHMNLHTRALTFPCPECPKTYTCEANRTRHIKKAHKDPDFMCHQCDFKTHGKFELRIHIQQVHMNIPYMPRILAEKRRIEKRRMQKYIEIDKHKKA